MPLTPDEISRRVATLIANLQAELARIDAEHGEARRAAIERSGLPASLVQSVLGDSSLQSRELLSSISVDMSQNNSTAVSPIRDRRGRPLETDARFPRALEAIGSNIDRWSKEHGYNPKRVRSWYQKSGGRRIPRKIAEAIELEMGKDDKDRPVVPASLESWPNGIAN